MMTYKEVKELIELAIQNPEAAKEVLGCVDEFTYDFKTAYDENKPPERKPEAVTLYEKLVREYLLERSYDVS